MNDPDRGDSPEVEAHLAHAQDAQKRIGKIVLVVIGAVVAIFVVFWIIGKLGAGGTRLEVPGRTPPTVPAATVPDSPITR